MAVTTRVESIEKDIAIILSQDLSPEAMSRVFGEFAQEKITEADGINRSILGRIPPRKVYVDGREGAALATVRPSGVIVAEWELIGEALFFIAEELKTVSPVGRGSDNRPGHPGMYKASHTLFADGNEVAASGEIPLAAEYVFLSALPYSRKLEKLKMVYEMTAAKAKSRFGNLANIKFSYRAPVGNEILAYVALGGWARDRRGRFGKTNATDAGRAAHNHERSLRVPAIVVTMRS